MAQRFGGRVEVLAAYLEELALRERSIVAEMEQIELVPLFEDLLATIRESVQQGR